AIYTELVSLITNEIVSNSDALVENGDGTFTHTAADGTVVTFDANTSTVTDNGDGTYTITNADGTTVTIDVAGDVLTELQDNTSAIYTEIQNIITAGSDALVDNGDGTFTHTAADGTATTFDVTQSGTGDPNTNSTTGSAGDIYVDENTGDIYTYDGTTWQAANVNLYNSDGALTGDRTLDLNGSDLEFDGTEQQTSWSLTGGITQSNLLPTSGSASMGFLGGNNTNLYIQAFSGGATQIIASGNATNFVIGTGYTANPTYLRFDTSPGGGAAPNPAMYITLEGNLGVGSDGLSASEKLDVTAGNARIRDINTNIGTSTDRIVVADADGVLKTVATEGIAIEPWQVQETTDKATGNAQEIYQTGSVAIGTDDIPDLLVGGDNLTSTVKLHVDGNITTTGKLYTTNSVYADYVFEKYFNGHSDLNTKYEFASLNDVKKFIKKNHHLPGITSIADLSKSEKGYTFDLTSLSIQQLEKIEELFIHTIEQQELLEKQHAQLEKQQKELAELKDRLAKIERLLGQQ
ncbi:hypothetical protein, partial [Parapedobacter sp.]